MTQAIAFAIGLRRKRKNKVLDVLFPEIHLETETLPKKFQNSPDSIHVLKAEEIETFTFKNNALKELLSSNTPSTNYLQTDLILFILTKDKDITSVEEGYFKLHLLSHRLRKPHELNLNGLFATLNNIAWTNQGPILPEDLDTERLKFRMNGIELNVSHVDKFPYLVNYHIPTGVRIASGSQVRLGAYLGEGTTIMPAGYVNFNAGTLGNAMVEGRVSAGVVIGKNTDIGGGASIMGTLSGGNTHIISIGEKCLLGANSGTGISLGEGCTIAAGLYIYAGMKISLYNEKDEPIFLDGSKVQEGLNTVKAKELSGKSYLLFIQDSQSGKVICKPNSKLIELNKSLHQND